MVGRRLLDDSAVSFVSRLSSGDARGITGVDDVLGGTELDVEAKKKENIINLSTHISTELNFYIFIIFNETRRRHLARGDNRILKSGICRMYLGDG